MDNFPRQQAHEHLVLSLQLRHMVLHASKTLSYLGFLMLKAVVTPWPHFGLSLLEFHNVQIIFEIGLWWVIGLFPGSSIGPRKVWLFIRRGSLYPPSPDHFDLEHNWSVYFICSCYGATIIPLCLNFSR